MTVGDLLKELSGIDKDMPVFLETDEYGFGEVERVHLLANRLNSFPIGNPSLLNPKIPLGKIFMSIKVKGV